MAFRDAQSEPKDTTFPCRENVAILWLLLVPLQFYTSSQMKCRKLCSFLHPLHAPSVLLVLLIGHLRYDSSSTAWCCWGYVSQEVQHRWKQEGYTVDQAMKTIEEAAELGERLSDAERGELYNAVRFIDRDAHKIYSAQADRMALWEKSQGSWELRLAYEDSRSQHFFPYPDFRDYAMAFTMIEPHYFGKGIARDPSFCFVAMGGPASFNARTRQLLMNYVDFYISGGQVPDWDLSYFMRGYARNWYEDRRKRPPLAFTLIGASEKSLVVRGSKTGGMAIFRRIEDDMRPAAYGNAEREGYQPK